MKDGWRTARFEEVLDIVNGRNQRAVESDDGPYPIYGSGGVMGRATDYLCEAGTTIIGRKGSINRPIFVDCPFWNVDTAFGLTPHDDLDARFLYRFCQLYDFSLHNKGTTLPSLVKSDLLAIRMPVPPLAEQQRIVRIVDRAFEDIGTAQVNAEKNLRNARFVVESQRRSVVTQLGDGWAERPLSELCDIKHGFAFKGEFFAPSGDYVVLTPGNFFESGGYRDRGAKQKYYSGEIPDEFVLSEGDMLVAMTEQAAGLLGSPILIPESGRFLHNQRLGLVTGKPGVPWTNEFFFHVFNTHDVRRAIHDSASGVKVRHTSPTKIGDVVVAFPESLSEQASIVSQLANLNTETERLESIYGRKLAALDELKKSLLHQAFTGQL